MARISAARAEARAARAALSGDMAALTTRLSPSEAARDLGNQARASLRGFAVEAADQVRRRPVAIVVAAALLGMALVVPAARRIALSGVVSAWRNRDALGRFIATRGSARKDIRP